MHNHVNAFAFDASRSNVEVLDDTQLSQIKGGDGAGLETAAGGIIGLGVCALLEPCGVITGAVAAIAAVGGLAWWLVNIEPSGDPCTTVLNYPYVQ